MNHCGITSLEVEAGAVKLRRVPRERRSPIGWSQRILAAQSARESVGFCG